jgi:CBS-domain-containing membrane protein
MAWDKKLFVFDTKFKAHPGRYIVQSGMAAIYIIIVLIALDLVTQTAIIATLGASAFIIFVRPHSYTSKTRVMFGGYVIGIVVGVGLSLVSGIDVVADLMIYDKVIFSAVGIGVTIFIMAITNTEHPPAAAMVLSLMLNPWNPLIIVFIIFCVILLGTIRKGFKPLLINLM